MYRKSHQAVISVVLGSKLDSTTGVDVNVRGTPGQPGQPGPALSCYTAGFRF